MRKLYYLQYICMPHKATLLTSTTVTTILPGIVPYPIPCIKSKFKFECLLLTKSSKTAAAAKSLLLSAKLLLRHFWFFATPWTVAHQAPMSMRFPMQEYWSESSFLPPWDLPEPGFEYGSPALADRFFTTEPPWRPPQRLIYLLKNSDLTNYQVWKLSN